MNAARPSGKLLVEPLTEGAATFSEVLGGNGPGKLNDSVGSVFKLQDSIGGGVSSGVEAAVHEPCQVSTPVIDQRWVSVDD